MAPEKRPVLSRVLIVCASAVVTAAIQTAAAAPPERPHSSAEQAKAAHHPAHHSGTAHQKQSAKPVAHRQTTRHEHKKDIAARPPANQPAAPAPEKSAERRSAFGSLSWGIETNQNVKSRSLAGEEADPDRDFQTAPQLRQNALQNGLPSFLGLSVKSEFSW